MRVLFLDPVGGIAGDMTVAALVDLGVPLELLRRGLAALPVQGLGIATERAARHTLRGLRFLVRAPDGGAHAPSAAAAVGSGPARLHAPPDHAAHGHRSFAEIAAMLSAAALPGRSGELALAMFRVLAEAEGQVHGLAPERVEFHEVGAWDSIADIVCTALAVDHLAPQRIYCGRVPLGRGAMDTAHGRMPVPGPATLLLLQGFPVEQGPPDYERTTPTGAAILAALARPVPVPFRFVPERVGIGVGSVDSPAVANVLRAVLGHMDDDASQGERIECAEVNLDDANPEWVGFLMERLLAQGALDVVLMPVHMKKNRPGTMVQVLYPPDLRETIHGVLFAEAPTLGVRWHTVERTVLPREAVRVTTPWGEVTGKVSTFRGRRRFAPEFESCRALALRAGVPLRDVYLAAELAFAAR